MGKGGRLEYQRGANHGRGGAWLTGSLVWQNGKTPLHLAAEKGHAAVVGALLAAEAAKDAKDKVRGRGCRASRVRFGVVWAFGRLVVLGCVTRTRCRYARLRILFSPFLFLCTG